MISIILTTYNRSFYLLKCLDSLAIQSLSSTEYEVIVIDNNCTDNTAVVVRKFAKDNPKINCVYFIETDQGLSFARNRGIKESKGDIVAFVDDDATAHKDYCKSLSEATKEYPDYHAFGGKIFPIFPVGYEPDWLSSYVWGMVAKIDLGDKIIPFKKKFPAGCNMAFRKEVFNTTGTFNTKVIFRSDDRDIFNRLKLHGFKVLYVPNISVNHNIPEERASRKGIRKISILSGVGEKNRLSGNFLGKASKFFNYSFKIAAAILLSLIYILRGSPKKALIINIMFWSLQGFVCDEKRLLLN